MDQLLYSVLTVFFTALITWFFTRNKQSSELKGKNIDNEIKSADWYKGLLDDAAKRIDQCLDIIKVQDGKILERDKKIDLLLIQIEHLTDELKKFKQLNGKTE